MPKKMVHLYPIVRVAIEVDAETDEKAIALAWEEFYADKLAYLSGSEFADADDGTVLVDQDGDTEFKNSVWYTQGDDGAYRKGLPNEARNKAVQSSTGA